MKPLALSAFAFAALAPTSALAKTRLASEVLDGSFAGKPVPMMAMLAATF